MASDALNTSSAAPVSLSDIKRMQSNDRVKYAIQHYVTDCHKAGVTSEKSFKKAQHLLLSYASLVYSDEQLNLMKQHSLTMSN